MKLHELQPAPGSHKPRTRVGRGIAAGKGKTAGRGTKGQKARSGGSIPPWFEGGQTPLHMRIPKLRGFKNRFKIEYEVVNVGAIGAAADRGAFEFDDTKKSAKTGPVTVNQDILRAVGLVRTLNKPLKILGAGELTAPLFVVADAFTASAREKIEAAGGSVNVLEVPSSPLAALGVDTDGAEKPARPKAATAQGKTETAAAPDPDDVASADASDPDEAEATRAAKRPKGSAKADATAPSVTGDGDGGKAPKTRAKSAKPSADADEAAGDDERPSGDDSAPTASSEPADDSVEEPVSADASNVVEETEPPSGDDA
jgi:large subunit ribosomal protein L15